MLLCPEAPSVQVLGTQYCTSPLLGLLEGFPLAIVDGSLVVYPLLWATDFLAGILALHGFLGVFPFLVLGDGRGCPFPNLSCLILVHSFCDRGIL